MTVNKYRAFRSKVKIRGESYGVRYPLGTFSSPNLGTFTSNRKLEYFLKNVWQLLINWDIPPPLPVDVA